MKIQVGNWGNSLAIRLPKFLVESLELEPNDQLLANLEDGKIILQPSKRRSKYTLDELLAQVEEPPEEEVDWGKPMGEEVW